MTGRRCHSGPARQPNRRVDALKPDLDADPPERLDRSLTTTVETPGSERPQEERRPDAWLTGGPTDRGVRGAAILTFDAEIPAEHPCQAARGFQRPAAGSAAPSGGDESSATPRPRWLLESARWEGRIACRRRHHPDPREAELPAEELQACGDAVSAIEHEDPLPVSAVQWPPTDQFVTEAHVSLAERVSSDPRLRGDDRESIDPTIPGRLCEHLDRAKRPPSGLERRPDPSREFSAASAEVDRADPARGS
jgi:hypothetical protein